ncbi:MAG TPA: LytTR family transcriptional regulator DNA-binding domain-containing protein [Pelobium sp.]|nr:LytTR family transcriptional regulator DNA-binding domain-containing protein [Pelobium sp.]
MINCFILLEELLIVERLLTLINSIPHFCIIGINTCLNKGIEQIALLEPDVIFVSERSVIEDSFPPECISVRLFETNILEDLGDNTLNINLSLNDKELIGVFQLIAGKHFFKKIPAFVDYFYLQGGLKGRRYKLSFNDIVYIESMSNYIIIHCKNCNHMLHLSLRDMISCLPSASFRRIHKSYIININYINAIEGNRVFLNDKTELTIGRFYKDTFISLLDNYTIKPKTLLKKG